MGEVTSPPSSRDTTHLDIGGEPVPVTVRIQPRARRFILKVDPISGGIVLVVPHRTHAAKALRFARDHTTWIAAQRERRLDGVALQPGDLVPLRGETHEIIHAPDARRGVWLDEARQTVHVSGTPEHVPRRVRDWLKRTAKQDLSARVAVHAEALGRRPKTISIRDTRSRWGSCTVGGVLNFSWRLILAPPFVLDYVAAHEVAHLAHHDHGPAFWRVVHTLFGDPAPASRWLKTHGLALHRYGAVRP